MTGPLPQIPGQKYLFLQNHPARVGEVISHGGRYWKAVRKHSHYTAFELYVDRVREGV